MRSTPLIASHRRLGARLTGFAGWEMPLSYAGTSVEHKAVRGGAGVFDLCHMGRLALRGEGARALLETVTPSDIAGLAVGQARYTVLLDEHGGMVDDVIVTRWADHYHLCVNAANHPAALAHLAPHAARLGATVDDLSAATGQIAVQGPASAALIRPLLAGPFPAFMHAAPGAFEGTAITVSRTGYTGELGVELFVPAAILAPLWERLVAQAPPIGLGARDTLRLEVGYPLYGHELSRQVTPVEAGLHWVVDWGRAGFLGHSVLIERRARRDTALCGFTLDGPGVPRDGCAVLHGGHEVGRVTSGNMGLSVGHGVGMAYLPAALTAPGTAIAIDVRGRHLPATVARPPFYRHGSVKARV
ncbi:MAG: glycine cleavage system aminomethyltransferase GcvT [Nitrospirae bacterium]|nr:glycine cleavage system aminomethyltransferase GcvT [Nitrospirota bacterium]